LSADAELRARVLPIYFRGEVRAAVAGGGAWLHLTGDNEVAGVSLWQAGRGWSTSLRDQAALGWALLRQAGLVEGVRIARRAVKVVRATSHPGSYSYLRWLGVDPARQGTGSGRALVEHGHRTYPGPFVLECVDTLVGYYSDLGFRETRVIDLGGDAPVLQVMERSGQFRHEDRGAGEDPPAFR
jgi:GNAT superfamily N-acetyltransferase